MSIAHQDLPVVPVIDNWMSSTAPQTRYFSQERGGGRRQAGSCLEPKEPKATPEGAPLAPSSQGGGLIFLPSRMQGSSSVGGEILYKTAC
jgi:hypothetical protein